MKWNHRLPPLDETLRKKSLRKLTNSIQRNERKEVPRIERNSCPPIANKTPYHRDLSTRISELACPTFPHFVPYGKRFKFLRRHEQMRQSVPIDPCLIIQTIPTVEQIESGRITDTSIPKEYLMLNEKKPRLVVFPAAPPKARSPCPERIRVMAQPRSNWLEARKKESDAVKDVYRVGKSALRAVASPRIVQLCKPRPINRTRPKKFDSEEQREASFYRIPEATKTGEVGARGRRQSIQFGVLYPTEIASKIREREAEMQQFPTITVEETQKLKALLSEEKTFLKSEEEKIAGIRISTVESCLRSVEEGAETVSRTSSSRKANDLKTMPDISLKQSNKVLNTGDKPLKSQRKPGDETLPELVNSLVATYLQDVEKDKKTLVATSTISSQSSEESSKSAHEYSDGLPRRLREAPYETSPIQLISLLYSNETKQRMDISQPSSSDEESISISKVIKPESEKSLQKSGAKDPKLKEVVHAAVDDYLQSLVKNAADSALSKSTLTEIPSRFTQGETSKSLEETKMTKSDMAVAKSSFKSSKGKVRKSDKLSELVQSVVKSYLHNFSNEGKLPESVVGRNINRSLTEVKDNSGLSTTSFKLEQSIATLESEMKGQYSITPQKDEDKQSPKSKDKATMRPPNSLSQNYFQQSCEQTVDSNISFKAGQRMVSKPQKQAESKIPSTTSKQSHRSMKPLTESGFYDNSTPINISNSQHKKHGKYPALKLSHLSEVLDQPLKKTDEKLLGLVKTALENYVDLSTAELEGSAKPSRESETSVLPNTKGDKLVNVVESMVEKYLKSTNKNLCSPSSDKLVQKPLSQSSLYSSASPTIPRGKSSPLSERTSNTSTTTSPVTSDENDP